MRRLHRWLSPLVLVGCETSRIDGSATVTVSVSGRILQADGSPAARVPVGLEGSHHSASWRPAPSSCR